MLRPALRMALSGHRRKLYYEQADGRECEVNRSFDGVTNGMDSSSSTNRHPGARLVVETTSQEQEGVHHGDYASWS